MLRPDRDGRIRSVSERVYRVLLLAYPREFRREHGAQMAQVFGDLCRGEKRRGGVMGLGSYSAGSGADRGGPENHVPHGP
jgi:hypothetical protein